MADEERQLTRLEAQTAFSRVLLEHIRGDRYPSVAQMDVLEASIPPHMMREYVGILLEKTLTARWPSIPMLRRIQALVHRL